MSEPAGTSDLDATVKRMLVSETLEPDELVQVLVERGHDKDDVAAAIRRTRAELAEAKERPAFQQALARRRLGTRLLQVGVLVLAVGLGFTLVRGGGILQLLLVIAVGGAFLAAGYRNLK